MTKWKVGDAITLRVRGVTKYGSPKVLTVSGMMVVDQECIGPIPRPMTDAEAALVKRIIDRRLDPECPGYRFSIETGKLADAVIAERAAAQTPPKPDPVEVFYEVARDNLSVCSSKTWKLCRSKPDECACRRYIAEGLAAVEAARGAK